MSTVRSAGPYGAVAEAEELPPMGEDKRQRWTCCDPTGPRTSRVLAQGQMPVICPVFRSDAHLEIPARSVVCPNCGNTQGIRRALPDET